MLAVEPELPPHSAELERATLGAVLLEPEGASERLRKLRLSDYYTMPCRASYAALCAITADARAPDVLLLVEALKQAGKLEVAGGIATVSALPEACPTVYQFDAHLAELRDYANKRELLRLCEAGKQAALSTNGSAGAALTDFANMAQTVVNRSGSSEALSIHTAAEIVTATVTGDDNLLGDRLLAKGQPLVLAGAGGLGKSRLLLQLAACTITGTDFCGLETHGGPVRWLVFQTENSLRRLQRDLCALQRWLRSDWQVVAENLHVLTVEQNIEAVLSLSDTEAATRMREAVERLNPDVVAFDALGDFMAGDPNSDADMRATVTAVSRLVRNGRPERCPVILHHALTGKAGAQKASGWDRSSFARNSKVLHAWTRGQINVAPGAADSNESLVLACGKCSNGKEFPPFAVRLSPEAMVYKADESFNLEEWQAEVSGTKSKEPLMTPERVRQLCIEPKRKVELSKAIQEDCGCARQVSYRYIKKAEKARTIHLNAKTQNYVAKV